MSAFADHARATERRGQVPGDGRLAASVRNDQALRLQRGDHRSVVEAGTQDIAELGRGEQQLFPSGALVDEADRGCQVRRRCPTCCMGSSQRLLETAR